MAKKLIVGQAGWTVPDTDASDVFKQVREALANATTAELQLVDVSGRPVSVFLNGRTVPTVVVDLDGDPRPSEMS
jgi:hypothetical protein